MGKQAKAAPTSKGRATTASERKRDGKQTPAQAARKAANREANEARFAANQELRAQGIPTPHEAKRMTRSKRRAKWQAANKAAEKTNHKPLSWAAYSAGAKYIYNAGAKYNG